MWRTAPGQPRSATFDLAFDLESSASTPGQMRVRGVGRARRARIRGVTTTRCRMPESGARFSQWSSICYSHGHRCVVVYFTMKICGVDVKDIDVLPKGPLLAFSVLGQNCGYLVAFTAADKHWQDGGRDPRRAGRRRIVARPRPRVSRTLMWLLLAVRRSGIRGPPSSAGIIGAFTTVSRGRASFARQRDGWIRDSDSLIGRTTPHPESRTRLRRTGDGTVAGRLRAVRARTFGSAAACSPGGCSDRPRSYRARRSS